MSDVLRRNNSPREPAAGNVTQVADGENIREVNLRNGTKHDIGLVNAAMLFFSGICEHRPDHFRVILDLAREQKPSAPMDVLHDLKRAGVVAADGSVNPLFRDVLLSACRETQEGIILSSPFAPKTATEEDIVRAAVAASEEKIVRFARKYGLGQNPNDDAQGR
jgi:hypothetical protein